MKPNTAYYILLTIIAALLCALTAACSSDQPGGEATVPTATFSILSRATSSSYESSSVYGKPDPTGDTELINSWTVIFIRHSQDETKGVVAEIISGNTPPADEDSFTLSTLTGTALYDIIAFANVSPAEAGASLSKGDKVDLTGLEERIFNIKNNPFTPGEKNIPMSGIRRNVVITDNNEVASSGAGVRKNFIEVVRMVAKVEFKILNSSSSAISMEQIGFGILNTGEIPLFPDYSILGSGGSAGSEPDILNEETQVIETIHINDDSEIAPDEVTSIVFYVRESAASTTHPAKRFFITLKYSKAGRESEEHYSPTDNLLWINRNDHIIIPLSVSDISVDWDVVFYPPIGGHPAVTSKVDGDSHFFTFGTQGKFAIRPIVRDSSGHPYPTSGMTFTINSITDGNGNPHGAGNAGIFSKTPVLNDSGEIIGELNSSEGTAVLNCTITISDGTSTETRSRNIYIIRKKISSNI